MKKRYYIIISFALAFMLSFMSADASVFADTENEVSDDAEYTAPSLNYHLVEGEGEYESLSEHLGDFGLYALDRAVTHPTKFNPLEEADYLPDLRNQNPYGTCWAHSIIAAGEIEYSKNKSHDKNINLSELQLAYFMYNSPATDPLGLSVGDSNEATKNNFLNAGGSVEYAKRIMQGWIGAADDAGELAYDNASSTLSLAADPYAYNSDICHLQNYYNISFDERDDVKQAIEDYGAVTVSYYDDDGYFKTGTDDKGNSFASFYCSDVKKTNHAVVIVGWDDDFSKDYFKTTPEGDGAWLIRNSWKNGTATYSRYNYFWLSYYDKSLNGGICVELEPADNYDNNYHYDGSAHDAYYPLKSGSKMANVFTAKANGQGELLRAVSFETKSTNVIYDIDIYTDLTDETDPESGTLVSSIKDGVTAYSGYYTIGLDEPVVLEAGETFSVVITLSHMDESDVEFSFESSIDSSDWIKVTASSNAGESFYNSGSGWNDKNDKSKGNFRIKAFTDNIEIEYVTVSFKDVKDKIVFDKITGLSDEGNDKIYSNGINGREIIFGVKSADEMHTVKAVKAGEGTALNTLDALSLPADAKEGFTYYSYTPGTSDENISFEYELNKENCYKVTFVPASDKTKAFTANVRNNAGNDGAINDSSENNIYYTDNVSGGLRVTFSDLPEDMLIDSIKIKDVTDEDNEKWVTLGDDGYTISEDAFETGRQIVIEVSTKGVLRELTISYKEPSEYNKFDITVEDSDGNVYDTEAMPVKIPSGSDVYVTASTLNTVSLGFKSDGNEVTGISFRADEDCGYNVIQKIPSSYRAEFTMNSDVCIEFETEIFNAVKLTKKQGGGSSVWLADGFSPKDNSNEGVYDPDDDLTVELYRGCKGIEITDAELLVDGNVPSYGAGVAYNDKSQVITNDGKALIHLGRADNGKDISVVLNKDGGDNKCTFTVKESELTDYAEPVYETKLGAAVKTATVYTGQANVPFAVPTFSAKTTHKSLKLSRENNGDIVAAADAAVDISYSGDKAVIPVYDIETGQVMLNVPVSAAIGKHVIRLSAEAGTNMVSSVKTVNVTVVKGIESLSIDKATTPERIYKPNGKGVTFKVTPVYNGGETANAPKLKKVTYEIVVTDETSELDYARYITANANGNITISKDLPEGAKFRIKITANDYDYDNSIDDLKKEGKRYCTSGEITVLSKYQALGNEIAVDAFLTEITDNGEPTVISDSKESDSTAPGYSRISAGDTREFTYNATQGSDIEAYIKYNAGNDYISPDLANLTLKVLGGKILKRADAQGNGNARGYVIIHPTAKVTSLTITDKETKNKFVYTFTNTGYPDAKAAAAKLTLPKNKLYAGDYIGTQSLDYQIKNYEKAGNPINYKIEIDESAVTDKNRADYEVLRRNLVWLGSYQTFASDGKFTLKLEESENWVGAGKTSLKKGTYKLIVSLGEYDSDNKLFTASAKPAAITLKIVDFKNVTGSFKLGSTYTITLSKSDSAALKYTAKEAKFFANDDSMQNVRLLNANIGGKTNAFTTYFELDNSDPTKPKIKINSKLTEAAESGASLNDLIDKALAKNHKNDLIGYVVYPVALGYDLNGKPVVTETRIDKITVTVKP